MHAFPLRESHTRPGFYVTNRHDGYLDFYPSDLVNPQPDPTPTPPTNDPEIDRLLTKQAHRKAKKTQRKFKNNLRSLNDILTAPSESPLVYETETQPTPSYNSLFVNDVPSHQFIARPHVPPPVESNSHLTNTNTNYNNKPLENNPWADWDPDEVAQFGLPVSRSGVLTGGPDDSMELPSFTAGEITGGGGPTRRPFVSKWEDWRDDLCDNDFAPDPYREYSGYGSD
ncbi:hypothetical protein HDU98_006895 [Podochytrium sp. JEL0797]|nr:hypothetical protein HDU98_006895 [Podochytrium sp. JEL0797]